MTPTSNPTLGSQAHHAFQRRSSAPSTVIVVLPAYNEEANIGPLLDRLDESLCEANLPYRVIVVDDGSQDATAEVLAGCAAWSPIEVLRHDSNQGLGATIRDGLLMAASQAEDRDIVVTMDSDETHTPGLILRMVRSVREGYDVVIASRYREGARVFGVPLHRRWLSFGASLLFRCVFPTPGLRDFTCGYRAYRGAVLKKAFSHYGGALVEGSGFQCMVDILLKLRSLGAIFGEVPLVLRYDLKAGKSKMDVGRTITQTLSLLVRRRLERRRK
jgi:dolichol-phosphate mannosyltransferase